MDPEHEKVWYAEGAQFSKAIAATHGQGLSFERFLWSGSNSIAARFRGAVRLADKLVELANEYPETPRFVVAHSHGGSISLAACGLVSERELPRGLICMATPFLY